MPGARGRLDLVALNAHDTLFAQAREGHGDRVRVYVVEFAFEFGAGPRLLVVAAEHLQDEHALRAFLLTWSNTLAGHGKNFLSFRVGPGAAVIRAGAS